LFALEEVYDIAEELGYPCVIPLVKTIKKIRLKPTDVYASLKDSDYSFLLESAIVGEKVARYSFLGKEPLDVIKIKDGVLYTNKDKRVFSNPIELLRKFIARYNVYENRLPRFFGGLLGYFSYDFIRYFEEIGNSSKPDLINDAEFMFVKDLIVFDHWRDEILLISNLLIEEEREIRPKFKIAQEIIRELQQIVGVSKPYKIEFNGQEVDVESNFKKEEFEDAVYKAKEYIYAGDIFQVVLSQRFSCKTDADPFHVYLALKEINPSPYMYFLKFGDLNIIGSSPEILVKTERSKVILRPIAGTRPRGRDIVEDEALGREMVNDPKERAEHVMLVDLGRNDIGKVSKFGTVHVNEFMAIEKYSHVQHIVSNVVGELREGMDSYDALQATFPAGTVSGAPKIRAMQIIEELEPVRRGIYAGAVGYFSFNGDMDFAITIRTIVMYGKDAQVQVGAGIVVDSNPEREYQETVNKGKAMLKAIEMVNK
jgi:anthranilate synthase component 1